MQVVYCLEWSQLHQSTICYKCYSSLAKGLERSQFIHFFKNFNICQIRQLICFGNVLKEAYIIYMKCLYIYLFLKSIWSWQKSIYAIFYFYLKLLIPMQNKGWHLALTLLKCCLSTKQQYSTVKSKDFKNLIFTYFSGQRLLSTIYTLSTLYPISEALWDIKMSAHSSELHVGFYEQILADLRLKRLKVIVDKGRPSEPENIVDWEKSYNQYKELKRRIQALLAEQQAVSDLL